MGEDLNQVTVKCNLIKVLYSEVAACKRSYSDWKKINHLVVRKGF